MDKLKKEILEDKKIHQFKQILEFRDNLFVRQNNKVPIGEGKYIQAKSMLPLFIEMLNHTIDRVREEERERITYEIYKRSFN